MAAARGWTETEEKTLLFSLIDTGLTDTERWSKASAKIGTKTLEACRQYYQKMRRAWDSGSMDGKAFGRGTDKAVAANGKKRKAGSGDDGQEREVGGDGAGDGKKAKKTTTTMTTPTKRSGNKGRKAAAGKVKSEEMIEDAGPGDQDE